MIYRIIPGMLAVSIALALGPNPSVDRLRMTETTSRGRGRRGRRGRRPGRGFSRYSYRPRQVSNDGTARALLISITYAGQGSALPGTVDDAKRTREYLVSQGFQQKNITWMHDSRGSRSIPQAPSNLYPTKANIEQQIKNIIRETRSGDSIYFMYSGHGNAFQDMNGNANQYINTVDRKQVTQSFFKDEFCNKLKSGSEAFVVFDCCLSGTTLDLPFQMIEPQGKLGEVKGEHIAKKAGPDCGRIVYLAGCKDRQTSDEITTTQFTSNGMERIRGGRLTIYLLELVKKEPELTLEELVKKMYTKFGKHLHRQAPQVSTNFPEAAYQKFKDLFDCRSYLAEVGENFQNPEDVEVTDGGPEWNPNTNNNGHNHGQFGMPGMNLNHPNFGPMPNLESFWAFGGPTGPHGRPNGNQTNNNGSSNGHSGFGFPMFGNHGNNMPNSSNGHSTFHSTVNNNGNENSYNWNSNSGDQFKPPSWMNFGNFGGNPFGNFFNRGPQWNNRCLVETGTSIQQYNRILNKLDNTEKQLEELKAANQKLVEMVQQLIARPAKSLRG